MAQTPVLIIQDASTIPYLATEDKTAGDVVLLGTIPAIVKRDIDYSVNPLGSVSVGAAGEIWMVPQKAEIITAGDAVYWDATGDPYGGTAGSGAASGTATANLMGTAAAVQPNGTNATAATDKYVYVVPSPAKRTATIAGAATADSITGSDSSLGIAGKTGTGSGGGAVVLQGGDGAGSNENGGDLTIRAGNAHGSGTDGALLIGATNTASIGIGAAGIVTTITGGYLAGTPRNGHTVTPVAAAGSTVADAGALPDTYISHITSDSAAKGVVLPAVTTSGVVRIVVNNSSTAAELYAESTGTVNGLSADASVVIPASKGVLCISTAAKTWKVFDLPAAASAS